MTNSGCLAEREAEQCAAHEGLAVRIANRVGMLDDDGLQAARIGVLQAVRRFDPERGTKFSTYAAYWIRAELQQEWVQRQLVSINPRALELRRRTMAMRDEFEAVSIEELAAAAGVSERQVRVFEALGALRARDLWGRSGGGLVLEERLAGSEVAVDEVVGAKESTSLVSETLARLEARQPRWALVVRRRMEGATLRVIGGELGVSRERVRQLEGRALAWLREQLG